MVKSLPSTNNPHLIMMKSQPWMWSHLQTVLGPLMIFMGRNLMMQMRSFWLAKNILIPCWMKVVFVLLLKLDYLNWKGPKVSLVPEPFWTFIFTSSASVGADAKRYVSTTFYILVIWTQSHQHYWYSRCNIFRSSFLPFWMLVYAFLNAWVQYQQGGGGLNRGGRVWKLGGIGCREKLQGLGGDTLMIT